jgi:hypothetical protein
VAVWVIDKSARRARGLAAGVVVVVVVVVASQEEVAALAAASRVSEALVSSDSSTSSRVANAADKPADKAALEGKGDSRARGEEAGELLLVGGRIKGDDEGDESVGPDPAAKTVAALAGFLLPAIEAVRASILAV